MSNIAQALSSVPTVELPGGWTSDGLRESVLEAAIDSHRFPSETDRILASYGDDGGKAFFPSFETLVSMGVNVEQLAIALENGLQPEGFGQTLATLDVATVNGALESLNDVAEDARLHPDPLDRIMHRHGECDCVAG